jgi:hypothetical protein
MIALSRSPSKLRKNKAMKRRLWSLIDILVLAACLTRPGVAIGQEPNQLRATFGTPRLGAPEASTPPASAPSVGLAMPLGPAESGPEEKRQETQGHSAMAGTAFFAADEQSVDFFAALQLAEAQNPNIGLSRQAIQEALAQQLQARSMMLPSVRAGGNYRSHQGVLQTSSGKMVDVDSSSLYLGNGALAEAAGTTVIPGVQVFGHVGDGIFEPLAARQLVVPTRSYLKSREDSWICFGPKRSCRRCG